MSVSPHIDSIIEIVLGVVFTWLGFRPSMKRQLPSTTTKLFRICGPGLVIVGVALLLVRANAVVTWTRTFTSDQAASAEFPGHARSQESTDTAAGVTVKRTSLTMTVPGRDIALFLSFSPVPEDARGVTDAQRVAGIIGYLGTQGATVVERDTDPTGAIHRVTFKQSDKKATTRMAVAYVGDNLYRVVASWADSDEDRALTDRFVTSFRLTGSDSSTKLVWVLLPLALSCRTPAPVAGNLVPPLPARFSGKAPARDAALWRAATESKADFVRDSATLVNVDSGTDDAGGLSRVAAFVAKRLTDLGANVEVLSALPAAGQMVRGTLVGTGSKNILLMIHLDTVFATGEAARRPFRVEGNKAFGPGVADAKGGVAIILHALGIARGRGFSAFKTLTVLFNPDEEKGSQGSRALIQTLAAQQDFVLSYEPPNGERVVVATNGIAEVRLNVKGRAWHASEPENGRNAAMELSSQLLQLKDLGDASKGTTVTWTVIRAGERVNVIPDAASATADMRLSDAGELARVRSDAARIIQRKSVPGTEVTVTVEERRPPFARNPQSAELGRIAAYVYQGLGKTLEPVSRRYGTDAGYAYRAGSTKPAVLEGLGIVGDGLHSPDEWADLDSVVPRLYLTVRLLELLSEAD